MSGQTCIDGTATHPGSSTAQGHRAVHSDTECWARAQEFLTELIGCPPDDLLWDDTHHLQGHGHLNGCELIVIAPRDDAHHTVVLTAQDWDAVRRSSTDRRLDLLNACAITDHQRLVSAIRRSRAIAC